MFHVLAGTAAAARTGVNLNPCRAYPGRRFCAVVDMGASGLSAMINAGAALEHEFDSIEVIEIGRPATAPEQDFTMQVCGRFLFYTIALYGPQMYLSAQPMDTGDPPIFCCLPATTKTGGKRSAGSSPRSNGTKSDR